ncbi:SDR family oxidoreductase [Chloroflexia bacterium SDU3-3]|nr:SDR family oxidoreductase [Chloroflexia bacterium SDU3-3]
MHIFVTGATGFVGSAVVRELLDAGHSVVGLARSDAGVAALASAGAAVQRGTLEDLDILGSTAAAADGVIHTAFIHNFNDFATSVVADRRAIEALGAALEGSGRPLIVTSGMAGLAVGRAATEDDVPDESFPRVSEKVGLSFVERGVRAMAMRLPPSVHGKGDHGFVPQLISVARERGVSAYVGAGENRWASVHRPDAARLYRLALEKGEAGTRLHAIGDEGVPARVIAEVIGRHLGVPVVSIPAERAAEHFGWIGAFFAIDIPGSSTITEQRFGWKAQGLGLIEDLEQGHYFDR